MSDPLLFAVLPGKVIPFKTPHDPKNLNDLYRGLPVGVYSVFRTYYHTKFIRLQNHLDRLDLSLSLLDWDAPINHEEIRQAIDLICPQLPWENSRLRVDILKSPLSFGKFKTTILIGAEELVDSQTAGTGVIVEITHALNRDNPMAKNAEFVFTRASFLSSQLAKPYEYIMTDNKDYLLEGTSSNFYGVFNGEVWTAEDNILKGITRDIVLNLLAKNDVPTVKQAIHISRITTLSEAFLSSSTRGLIPVIQIGENVIGEGTLGPVFRILQASYDRYIKENAKPPVW